MTIYFTGIKLYNFVKYNRYLRGTKNIIMSLGETGVGIGSPFCYIRCWKKYLAWQQNIEQAAISERTPKVLKTAQETIIFERFK